jgi:glycosyltransferase involved in cell wall biosynthesis
MSKVTVLMTVYNGARHLGEAIDSVLSQDHDDVELVLIDDGSNDESADVARRYGDSIVFRSDPKAGAGAARNQALKLATGDFITLVDADDLLVPGSISSRMALFEEGVDAVSGWIEEFITPEMSAVDREALRELRPPSPARLPGCLLLTAEAYRAVGDFDPDLVLGVGLKWAARFAEMGFEERKLNEVVLRRRIHGANTNRREAASVKDYVKAVRSTLERRRAMQAEREGE